MTSPQIRSPFWCCVLFLIDNRMLRRKKIAALLCNGMSIQNTLHGNELDLAIFDQPVKAWEQKSKKSVLFWGLGGGTMMLFLIIGALAGVLLGLRFKVLILVPCILIIACAIVATGDGLKAITLTILATAVLIQIGYVLGLVVRFWAGRYLSKPKTRAYHPSKSKPVGF
jgi:hypothetical protein